MTYPSPTQIPVTLIAGYLGAGKTTLVNKLLNSKKLPANTAVLVNDFGDINIDEQLIKNDSQADNVIGLANGCICCSIADDLTAALEQVRASGVERVILESVVVWLNLQKHASTATTRGFTPKPASYWWMPRPTISAVMTNTWAH